MATTKKKKSAPRRARAPWTPASVEAALLGASAPTRLEAWTFAVGALPLLNLPSAPPSDARWIPLPDLRTWTALTWEQKQLAAILVDIKRARAALIGDEPPEAYVWEIVDSCFRYSPAKALALEPTLRELAGDARPAPQPGGSSATAPLGRTAQKYHRIAIWTIARPSPPLMDRASLDAAWIEGIERSLARPDALADRTCVRDMVYDTCLYTRDISPGPLEPIAAHFAGLFRDERRSPESRAAAAGLTLFLGRRQREPVNEVMGALADQVEREYIEICAASEGAARPGAASEEHRAILRERAYLVYPEIQRALQQRGALRAEPVPTLAEWSRVPLAQHEARAAAASLDEILRLIRRADDAELERASAAFHAATAILHGSRLAWPLFEPAARAALNDRRALPMLQRSVADRAAALYEAVMASPSYLGVREGTALCDAAIDAAYALLDGGSAALFLSVAKSSLAEPLAGRMIDALLAYARDRRRPAAGRIQIPETIERLQSGRDAEARRWLQDALRDPTEDPAVHEAARVGWSRWDPALLRRMIDAGEAPGGPVPEVASVYNGLYEERGVLWEYQFIPALATAHADRIHHDEVLRHLDDPSDASRAACAAYLAPRMVHWHPELTARFDRALAALESDTRTHAWETRASGYASGSLVVGAVAASIRALLTPERR